MADQVIRNSFSLTTPGGGTFPRGGVVITSTAGFILHIFVSANGTGTAGTGFMLVGGFKPPAGVFDEVEFVVPADSRGAKYLGCFGSGPGLPIIVRGSAPDEPGTLLAIITVVTDLTATVTFEVIP